MKYDVIVIGGGIAGYASAMRCLEKGLKTALINNGRSALHFSSGSIDLLSARPDGRLVDFPYKEIDHFTTAFPRHPYAKIGSINTRSAMHWFSDMMTNAGIPLSHNYNAENHQRITTLGTLKTSFLSQSNVEKISFANKPFQYERIVVVSIDGFRDFQASLVVDNLRQNSLFKDVKIESRQLSILHESNINFRSNDFVKLLESEQGFIDFADKLVGIASAEELVVIPAIFGAREGVAILQRLREHTGLNLHEVPTMPPSMMGIRLEDTLENRFIQLGGILLKGDAVTRGKFSTTGQDLKLDSIWTRNLRDYALTSDAFVLASGSFFSCGLRAEKNNIVEPIFGLDTCYVGDRDSWSQDKFLSPKSHAFLSFGVETNACFQPSIVGQSIKNLYCCGSILAHYNPITEGSGGGVAIASAYFAADQITQKQQAELEVSKC